MFNKKTIMITILFSYLTPLQSFSQNSEKFYISLDSKALRVQLPSYDFYQRFDDPGAPPRSLIETFDTADGDISSGVKINGLSAGVILGDPLNLGNTASVELSGFYSKLKQNDASDFSGDAGVSRVGWTLITGSGGAQFGGGDDISTRTQRNVTYATSELIFKQKLASSKKMTIAPYIGLNSLRINQSFDTDAFEIQRPTNTLTSNETLNTSYKGIVAGVNMERQLSKKTKLSIDSSITPYKMNTNYKGNQDCQVATSLSCNNVTANLSLQDKKTTYGAKVGVALAHDYKNFTITYTGEANYLKDVPKVIYPTSRNNNIPATLITEGSTDVKVGLKVTVPF